MREVQTAPGRGRTTPPPSPSRYSRSSSPPGHRLRGAPRQQRSRPARRTAGGRSSRSATQSGLDEHHGPLLGAAPALRRERQPMRGRFPLGVSGGPELGGGLEADHSRRAHLRHVHGRGAAVGRRRGRDQADRPQARGRDHDLGRSEQLPAGATDGPGPALRRRHRQAGRSGADDRLPLAAADRREPQGADRAGPNGFREVSG
jgi:hypothetical protein